jgi:hypothetical protein
MVEFQIDKNGSGQRAEQVKFTVGWYTASKGKIRL